jgi:hypothetical protein
MFQLVVSTLAIFLAVAYAAYVLLRERRSLNAFAVAAGLLCFSLVEVFDLLALENPDNYLTITWPVGDFWIQKGSGLHS